MGIATKLLIAVVVLLVILAIATWYYLVEDTVRLEITSLVTDPEDNVTIGFTFTGATPDPSLWVGQPAVIYTKAYGNVAVSGIGSAQAASPSRVGGPGSGSLYIPSGMYRGQLPTAPETGDNIRIYPFIRAQGARLHTMWSHYT